MWVISEPIQLQGVLLLGIVLVESVTITSNPTQPETKQTVLIECVSNEDRIFRLNGIFLAVCNKKSCIPEEDVKRGYVYKSSTYKAEVKVLSINRSRDAGVWTCLAEGNSSIDLKVYTSPGNVSFVQPIPPDGDLGITSITLTCRTDRCAFPAPNITWHYMKGNQKAPFLLFSGKTTSNASECTQPDALYTSILQLPRGTNFSENILFTTKFVCGISHPSLGSQGGYSDESNNVTFAVQVNMVTLVDSAGGTKVFYDGFHQTLSCISSPSRPVPIITWWLLTHNDTIKLNGNIVENQTTYPDGLIVQRSELTLMLEREQKGKIFCNCSIDGQPPVMSNTVTIDVLYPADQPNVHEYNNGFPWMENQTGMLRCNTSNYGNPTSNVIWTTHRGTTDSDGNLAIAELKPQDNGKKVSCQLSNNFTADKNLTVISEPLIINVEYSPIIQLNTTSPVTANETQSIRVLCSANGNPKPDTPVWERWSDSTLRIDNISRTHRGKYKCSAIAKSTVHGELTSTTEVDVLVQYAPELNVTSTGPLHQNMTSNVTCEAKGFPSQYKFHPWKHMLGDVTIRSGLSGTIESTANSHKNILILNRLSLQDMGRYVCYAENGIRGINGKFTQIGALNLTVKGTPEVLNRKDYTFAGEIGSTVNMAIPFYSDPVIMNFTFQRNGSDVKNTSTTTMDLRKDTIELMFHDTKVTLDALSANLLVQNLTWADFNDYMLVLGNSLGKTEIKLKLKLSGRPMMVDKFYYNKFIKDGIEFHFDPGFNGGRNQTFTIEYRSVTSLVWKNTSIIELREDQTEYRLPNGTYSINVSQPFPGEYIYRIYSQNYFGKSEYSMNVSVRIPQGEHPSDPMVAAVAGSIATAAVIILGVGIIRKLVKSRFISGNKSSRACQSKEVIRRRRQNNGAFSERMPIQNPNANTDNMYENAMAEECFGADVYDDDANVYENQHDVNMSFGRNNGNLIYAELELANPMTSGGRPIIHGLQNRTEYAEIVFGEREIHDLRNEDENEVLAPEGAN